MSSRRIARKLARGALAPRDAVPLLTSLRYARTPSRQRGAAYLSDGAIEPNSFNEVIVLDVGNRKIKKNQKFFWRRKTYTTRACISSQR